MKKIGLLIISAILIGQVQLRADEGMWLLPLLEKFNIKIMKEMGCKLSAKQIYDLNSTSLKDAVVALNGGGCTAELISKNGLLVTNHHCGYAGIQQLSTVEHDYLKDGYWAMNSSQEIPVPGYRITIIESFTDVTKVIEEATKEAKGDSEYRQAYNEAVAKLIKEATQKNQYLEARVTNFYYGNQYYLIVSKTFKDIRFVGAPPSSIGKFGADTDNWMWPRHTGDFSMFRVYADKNNNPAAYSADNVPYTPKKFLNISLAGVKPNDYTMIMGFPGRTTRYMTASEAKEAQQINNAISIYVRGVRQSILMKDMLADPKVKIQYASKYASSSNGWKKWIGMNETFDKLKIIERRAENERLFTNWVNENQERKAKYGEALSKIDNAVNNRAKYSFIQRYLIETIGSIEITNASGLAFYKGDNPIVKDFYKDYSAQTDRKVAKEMVKIYRDKVKDTSFIPSFYKTIDKDYKGDSDAYVDYIYDNSSLTDLTKLNKAKADSVNLKKDPAIIFTSSFMSVYGEVQRLKNKDNRLFDQGKKEYTAGLLEMKGNEPVYPDANSTMRLTYGKILPYSPKDAVEYDFITTLDGVMQKEDPDNWEFVVPDKLKKLYRTKDFVNQKYGSYALKNGKMPVAFISNNDITGGNSGSPIMNAKGELIGLAFDGNWEAMSGDVIFEPQLQRCISVDIRYVLFIVDKFGGAGYLLNEMNIIK
jgi:hypothetical protein